jgi:tetratricopeptide (TPR) repeat protein
MEDVKESMERAFVGGRFGEAMVLADRYLETVNGYDSFALLVKAKVMAVPGHALSDMFRAIGYAFFALKYGRSDPTIWHGVGFVCSLCGLSTEAERCYREALKLDPTFFYALTGLASLSDQPGSAVSRSEELQLLRRAMDSDPQHWNPPYLLARMLKESGRYQEATALCRRALELYPKDRGADQIQRQMSDMLRTLEQAGHAAESST